MLYIRTLLSPRSRSTQEAQVNHLLAKTGVTGSGELQSSYGTQLLQSLSKSMAPEKFMRVLLAKLQELQRPQEKGKLLTLIHSAVCQSGYAGNVLEQLSSINLGAKMQPNMQGQEWFIDLYRAYLTYLTKLASVSEVYIRARGEGQGPSDNNTLLFDLFRLVNQINLILDALINTFNTLGRYYKKEKKVYRAMYKVLRNELGMLYDYMQKTVDMLFSCYQGIEREHLRVFIGTVPEIELMADRLQEFLMNKYFQGAKPEKRLYFKADEVAKVDYYLKTHIN